MIPIEQKTHAEARRTRREKRIHRFLFSISAFSASPRDPIPAMTAQTHFLREEAPSRDMPSNAHLAFGGAPPPRERDGAYAMCATRFAPNSEHLISVAPCMRRAKS